MIGTAKTLTIWQGWDSEVKSLLDISEALVSITSSGKQIIAKISIAVRRSWHGLRGSWTLFMLCEYYEHVAGLCVSQKLSIF